MTKKETYHCDVCGCRVDYYSGGDLEIMGFKFDVVQENTERGSYSSFSKTVPFHTWLHLHNHIRSNCGHSSSPMPSFHWPEHICSPKCLRKYVEEWLDKVDEAWGNRTHYVPAEKDKIR